MGTKRLCVSLIKPDALVAVLTIINTGPNGVAKIQSRLRRLSTGIKMLRESAGRGAHLQMTTWSYGGIGRRVRFRS